MKLYNIKTLYNYLKTNQFSHISLYQFTFSLTLLLNNNKSAILYEKNKIKNYQRIFINLNIYIFTKNVTQKKIIYFFITIKKLIKINSITISNPIPKTINSKQICNHLSTKKDIDNFKNINKKGYNTTCVANAIEHILAKFKKYLIKSKIIVIGTTPAVGQSIFSTLIKHKLNVSLYNEHYYNLLKELKNADVTIVALRKPKFLKQEFFKQNSMVLDVGIIVKKKITGNLNFSKKESFNKIIYTPVPGGVGPLTIMYLLKKIKKNIQYVL